MVVGCQLPGGFFVAPLTLPVVLGVCGWEWLGLGVSGSSERVWFCILDVGVVVVGFPWCPSSGRCPVATSAVCLRMGVP